jgi:hypothetical protein
VYEITMYGLSGRWRPATMAEALKTIRELVYVSGHGELERHVRLGPDHIAFYVRTPDCKPDQYVGVIDYCKDPWHFACGDCGGDCEQGACKNWKSVSESNPY